MWTQKCSVTIQESDCPLDFLGFSYENARKLRVAIIHGLARMAAIMASTYKAYLGVGLGPLSVRIMDFACLYQGMRDDACLRLSKADRILYSVLQFLTQFRIPHPGRVGGRFFIDIGMPLMLSWVLGGNG